MGNDSQGLHAVRQAIELERRIVAARLAAAQQAAAAAASGEGQEGEAPQQALSPSYFSSINAAWEDSDFDSGAATDGDDGASDATDLDSEFD